MTKKLEHTNMPDCPACKIMYELSVQITDGILGNADQLSTADRMEILITVLGVNLALRTKGGDHFPNAVSDAIRGVVYHAARVGKIEGKLTSDDPAAFTREMQAAIMRRLSGDERLPDENDPAAPIGLSFDGVSDRRGPIVPLNDPANLHRRKHDLPDAMLRLLNRLPIDKSKLN